MTTQSQLNIWLQEEIDRVKALNIEVLPILPIVHLKPFKRKFGQCKHLPSSINEISISTYFLNNKESDIRNTLAHEVLHACKGGMKHGNVWKSYANKFNRAYGYNIKRVGGGSDDKKLEVDISNCYIVQCQCCGMKITRFRKSGVVKNPEKYRCGKCHSELKLIKG